MGPNEIPEKIYLTTDEKNSYVFTQKRSDSIGIEYTRTDAFIEKACDWMSNHLQNEYGGFSDFIKAFKKAMK